MSRIKKQYSVGLDYSPEKQHRLERFVDVMGYKSVRAFIVQTIDDRIEAELAALPDGQRDTVEKLMDARSRKVSQ